jgi:benzoyl-CoA reductase/2-hydroxyglutaryl-CoA dehydratase subunit BcrC/BadD/HgdB
MESKFGPINRSSNRGPYSITDYMDEIGFNVVADDLICGSRYIDTEGKTDGDAVENLVDRHFRRAPFTSIYGGADRLYKNLIRKFKESGAKGLIYLQVHLKIFV